MITRALAQNLVAIGMADFIQRLDKVANTCRVCHFGHCCQEQCIDTLSQVLQNLGCDIYDEDTESVVTRNREI